MSDFTEIFNEISELLQKGKAKEIVAAVEKALNEGVSPSDILDQGLISGMNVIGQKFKNGEIFVPQVLIAARAMNQGASALKPALMAAGVKPAGKAIICTVKGDLHDIGKNLVKMMLEGNGIEVNDLGTNCSDEKIVEAVRVTDAKVLCLSALLTTTMMAQKDAIDAIKTAGLRDKVKIMVGGAPVTQGFADEIGADAYAPDAPTAAQVCLSFFP
jgi:5-methyltetrahydrofolate--homocysteine methyltransferase